MTKPNVIRRYIIAALACSSLVGCVLFALSVGYKFGYSGSPIGLILARGTATLMVRDASARHAGKWGFTKIPSNRFLTETQRQQRSLWGFPSADKTRHGIRFIRIPLWIPTLAFGAYPMLAFMRGPLRRLVQRRLRRRRGLCEGCGYDIRASVDRCPECGTEISSNSANAL